MSGKKYSILLVTIALSFTGCSTFEGYPADSSLQSATSLKALDEDLDNWVTQYEDADHSQRSSVRNNLLRRRMIMTDLAYEQFEKSIYVQNLRGTVYTDWTTNLLTSAGPATDHIPTRNMLSGLSTVLSGGKAIYESNVISKGVMSALIAEMRTSRAEVRNRIRERTDLGADQYDLYDALADLNDYKVAGSIPSAIASLNARASDEQNTVEATSDRSIRASGLGRYAPQTDTGAVIESQDPFTNPDIPAVSEPAPQNTTPPIVDTAVVSPPGTPPDYIPPTTTGSYSSTQEDFSKWVQKPENRLTLEKWLRPKRISVEDFLTKDKYENLRVDAAIQFNVM
ncbi:MAG: hypothetical protein KJ892_03615 [Gammaproteobacteria bacterium]|nr:hypothetical protein [Gammaproteobacteria bacterium]